MIEKGVYFVFLWFTSTETHFLVNARFSSGARNLVAKHLPRNPSRHSPSIHHTHNLRPHSMRSSSRSHPHQLHCPQPPHSLSRPETDSLALPEKKPVPNANEPRSRMGKLRVVMITPCSHTRHAPLNTPLISPSSTSIMFYPPPNANAMSRPQHARTLLNKLMNRLDQSPNERTSTQARAARIDARGRPTRIGACCNW
jgi:hypothetical protein